MCLTIAKLSKFRLSMETSQACPTRRDHTGVGLLVPHFSRWVWLHAQCLLLGRRWPPVAPGHDRLAGNGLGCGETRFDAAIPPNPTPDSDVHHMNSPLLSLPRCGRGRARLASIG